MKRFEHDDEKVSRTARFRRRVALRLKFLFGRCVKLGREYATCRVDKGVYEETLHNYTAMRFDDGMLLLVSKDRRHFAIVGGDIASFRGTLYADVCSVSFSFADPIEKTLQEYAQRHAIDAFDATDAEAVFPALRGRYPKFPSTCTRMVADAYAGKYWTHD